MELMYVSARPMPSPHSQQNACIQANLTQTLSRSRTEASAARCQANDTIMCEQALCPTHSQPASQPSDLHGHMRQRILLPSEFALDVACCLLSVLQACCPAHTTTRCLQVITHANVDCFGLGLANAGCRLLRKCFATHNQTKVVRRPQEQKASSSFALHAPWSNYDLNHSEPVRGALKFV